MEGFEDLQPRDGCTNYFASKLSNSMTYWNQCAHPKGNVCIDQRRFSSTQGMLCLIVKMGAESTIAFHERADLPRGRIFAILGVELGNCGIICLLVSDHISVTTSLSNILLCWSWLVWLKVASEIYSSLVSPVSIPCCAARVSWLNHMIVLLWETTNDVNIPIYAD